MILSIVFVIVIAMFSSLPIPIIVSENLFGLKVGLILLAFCDCFALYTILNCTTSIMHAQHMIMNRDEEFECAMIVDFCGETNYISYYYYYNFFLSFFPQLFAGKIITIAGDGNKGFLDGSTKQAKFSRPCGIALNDDDGVLYVCDTDNHCVRTINLAQGWSCF